MRPVSLARAATLIALLLAEVRVPGAAAQAAFDRVDRAEIVRAMRMQQGYDIRATSNGARFQGEVILQLVRWARSRHAEGRPLLIRHDDYFHAYLAAAGLTPEMAPTFARLPYQHGQDLLIEYRTDHVIRQVVEGPRPLLAVSVMAVWPDGPNSPPSYSYIDTSSDPHLQVTHERVYTYRLLVYEDMTVWDEIEGVFGRATSGVLGLLFSIMGEARAVQSRTAISADGLQITLARARKGVIRAAQTVTVYPDGRGEKGIPRNRPDLVAINRRLQQPIRVTYLPLSFGDR